ncbi:uncharacterized protein NECHADRAFT_44873 [Fusarium vanettenii 77-13-4]|uniref:3-hydroxyacyl-CoA dehydrogenase n=1 Tax=Fusarium vanettenii (strain ATCC MYA-4622 / CBS 123669 / FGSC 9596 / NRRL 45880 / 77-13-4) TaxID=660122 RepID=C7ZLR0_FUSV7|nr:uncharacterized protein NECHADRAFT_44873 [Fusarium vanettenii 77-13-4]EEU35074.1 hypothetical protein NECHADRAFT_44873 [Fusarium vanettenii 77-13-4]
MSRFVPSTSLFSSLSGRVVVAAGAATGIGESLTRLLVSHGAHVYFGDINIEAGSALEQELSVSPQGSATFVKSDVQEYTELYTLFRKAYDRHGRVDHAVYCAGLLEKGRYLNDTSLTVDTVGDNPGDLSALDVNLIGAARFTRLAVVFLQDKQHEQPENKSITLLSSIGAIRDSPGVPLYQTGKVGVLGLLRGMRHLPFAVPQGSASTPIVRVNVICPGVTDTPMTAHLLPHFKASGGRAHWQTAEAVAEVIIGVMVGGRDSGKDQILLAGKSLYVEAGKAFEIEDGLQRERPAWLGQEPERMLTENRDFIKSIGGIRKKGE